MSEQKTKTNETPARWRTAEPSLRAVQVAFDLEEQIQRTIRLRACELALSPSDCIRQILGLKVTTKPVRPRLTASFTEQDYQNLADRYALSPDQKIEIKRRVMQELMEFAEQHPHD